jgi:general stress protein YciG
MAEKEKKGGMTVREAGHKGGEKTAETHGKEFYEEIGKKGGEKVAEEKGPEFYSKIGHKGGEKVRELVKKGEEAEKK